MQQQAELKLPLSARLGTFAGVFTPSILTILGLVLFLREGYVVGRDRTERAAKEAGVKLEEKPEGKTPASD